MAFLHNLLGFFNDTTFCVPLGQVVAFVALISVSMLLGRYRMGLVVTLSFVFFWSFVLNFKFFVGVLNDMPWGLQLYGFSALLMFAMIILGLFVQRAD